MAHLRAATGLRDRGGGLLASGRVTVERHPTS